MYFSGQFDFHGPVEGEGGGEWGEATSKDMLLSGSVGEVA